MSKRNDYLRNRRDVNKILGLCINCSSPTSGFVCCDKCREKYKMLNKELRNKRKENRLCSRCNRKLNEMDNVVCPACALQRHELPTRLYPCEEG